jgi:spermidine synthase
VRHVTLVELSRTLLENLAEIPLFRSILADPRLEVVHDDGRRFLLHTEARYDLVLMDPLRTTTAYSNNLYSLEFFRLIARHLTDCGVLLLWTDDALVVPRTAATAFPRVALYPLSTDAGFVLASACALSRSEERLWGALGAAPPAERPALARWLLPLRPALERDELLRLTAGHRINRDFEPVSEYYLGPR